MDSEQRLFGGLQAYESFGHNVYIAATQSWTDGTSAYTPERNITATANAL